MKLNALVANGKLTPLGAKVTAYFADELARIKDPSIPIDIQRRAFFTLVLARRQLSAAQFFTSYPQESASLLGLYYAQLPDDDADKVAAELNDDEAHRAASRERNEKITAARQARALAAATAEESVEPLVIPHNRQLTRAGVALVERIAAIARTGLPEGVPMPPALQRYLFITGATIQHSPASFLSENRVDAEALREVVPLLEGMIENAQVLEGLEQVAESLEGKMTTDADGKMVLREQSEQPATPDWNAILRDGDTFAAYMRSGR